MTAAELAGYLDAYAASFDAPIEHGSDGRGGASRDDDGYLVRTTATTWRARSVVVATGWCDRPSRAGDRRRPAAIARTGDARGLPEPPRPPGRAACSSSGLAPSGVQLADELARAGREVVLAVGSHSRLPRQLPRHGHLVVAQRDRFLRGHRRRGLRCVEGAGGRRRCSSSAGTTAVTSIWPACDVSVSVSPAGSRRSTARRLAFADDLPATVARADARLERLRARIDRFVDAAGLTDEVSPADARDRLPAGPSGRRRSTSAATGISAVIWATGYRRSYPWLHVPSSTGRARSCTDAASRRHRASTSSASASSTGATRTSSTASATTPPS